MRPTELTRLFAVKPTLAFARGEPYPAGGRVRHRELGKWSVCSADLIRSTSVEQQALALLAYLEPAKAAIQAYTRASAAKPCISFWWDGSDYIGGFSLQSDTMRRLADLCQRIHFHYIYSEDQADSVEPPAGKRRAAAKTR